MSRDHLPQHRHTPETKAKMRASHMGHLVTPETRRRISASKMGHAVSDETRARISAARQGQVFSPEARAKMGLAHRGNTYIRDASIKGECVYCFGPATTHDHIIPRGREGWDAPGNIVPACLPCNTSKRDRTPEEWLADGLRGGHHGV